MSRTKWLFILALALGLCAGCDGEKKTPPPAPAAPTVEAADAGAAAKPAAVDAASAVEPAADAAPQADAGSGDAAEAEKGEGGGPGLLPSPDFNLKPPGLKLPGEPNKRGMLGGGQGGEEKPRLLDLDLKKGE